MKVYTATVTVYVKVYDDTVVDSRRLKQMETSLHQGAEELRSLMTDHGHAEVTSSTLLSLGADEVPVWVDKAWSELEDLKLEPEKP
jgi:hypothetical protein